MLGLRVRGVVAAVLAAQMVLFGLPGTVDRAATAGAEEPPPGGDPPGELSYADAVSADGPLSWFRLDASDGAAPVDSMGFDLTAVFGEGASVDAEGLAVGSQGSLRAGSAGGLSSAGLGLPAGGSPRTLEAWAEVSCVRFAGCAHDDPAGPYGPGYVTGGGDGWPIVAYGDGFGLYLLASGQLQVRWGSDPGARADVGWDPLDYPAPGEVEAVASHFVVSYDGSTVSVFVDGQRYFSQAVMVNTVVPGGGLSAGLPLDRVDEVAVYDTALPEARVRAHWVRGVSEAAGVCGGVAMSDPYGSLVAAGSPVGFWRFEDSAADGVVVDSSGSCHDGAGGSATTSPVGVVGAGVGSGGSRMALLAGGVPVGGARTVETWYRGVDPAALVFMTGDQVGLMTAGVDQLVVFNPSVGEMIPVQLPAPVTDGQWHLVALGWDPGSGAAAVHFDGAEVWAGTLTAPAPVSGLPSGLALFSGEFDETAVYPSMQTVAASAGRFAAAAVTPLSTATCSGAGSDRYSDAVLADTPVRFYRLDERRSDDGAAVALDAADGDGCQNALLGGGTLSTPGALSDLANAGVAQHGGLVAVSEGVGLGDGTDRSVEMWIRPDAGGVFGRDGSERPILDVGDGTGFSSAGGVPGRLRFRYGPGVDEFVEFSVAAPQLVGQEPSRQWHHVVASIAAGVLTVVANGHTVSQATVAATAGPAGLLRLGLQSTDPSGVPSGVSVDEVAVYDSALSLDRIRAHWVIGASGAAQVCPTSPQSGHAQGVLEDGPVAFYRLGELAADPSGRVAFDVVSCVHGSYGAATQHSEAVAVDGALTNDDSGAAARAFNLADPDGDQPLLSVPLDGLPVGDQQRSIEFWGRIPEGSAALSVAYGTRLVAVFLADGTLIPGAGPPTSPLVSPGSWHHFAATIDGTNYTLYRDGVVDSEGVWPQGDTTASGQFLTVISGAVDELAVYDHVLSAQQVADRFADASKSDTVTALTAPEAPWGTVDPVTFEVQVDTPAAVAVAQGTVRLYDGLTEIASGGLDMNGHVSIPVTLGEGAHHVVAVYDGNQTNVSSRSTVIDRQIDGLVATTVDLAVSEQVSTYGEEVTATATLTSTTSTSGEIEFVVDGSVRDIVPVDSGTPTPVTLPGLDPGHHEITARFAGTDTHDGSVSPPVSWWVLKATPVFVDTPPATQLLSEQSIGVGLQRLGVGANPSGWVELWVDGQHVRSNMLWSFAMFGNTSTVFFDLDVPLSVGVHDLRFVYSGDPRYERVEWSAGYEVLPDQIGIDVVTSDPQVDTGAPITFTATVHAAGNPVTQGSVTFTDNWNDTYTTAVDSQGHATWTVTDLTAGSHDIRARYDSGELSAPVTQQVGRLVDITINETQVDWAGQITGTVTSATAGDATVPTGWVSFSQPDGTLLGSAEINPEGTFEMSVSEGIDVGPVDLELFYYPYQNDTAPMFAYTAIDGPTLDVVPEETAVEVVMQTGSPSDPDTALTGYAVVLSTGIHTRAGVGMVSFYIDDAATPFFTGTLGDEGWVWVNDFDVPQGPHTIRAVYGGSETMAQSTGSIEHRVRYNTSVTVGVEPGTTTALGSEVTYTAEVTANTADIVATGTVQFAIDGTNIGEPQPLDATGRASIDVDPANWPSGPQTVGEHHITATYTPDDLDVFLASTAEATHWVLSGSCPSTPTDGHAQRILADEPVAFYRFDELATQPDTRVAFDVIGCVNGIYGEPTATTAATSIPGVLTGSDNTAATRGWNLDPNGDAPLVMVPLDGLPTASQGRTIEFWGKAPADSTAYLVTLGTEFLVFAEPSGQPMFAEPGEVMGADVGDLSTWRHFVYVFDGTAVTLYLDGTAVVTAPWVSNPDAGGGGYLAVTGGAVDELAVYDKVLTADTITAHHSEAAKADTNTHLDAPVGLWDYQTPITFEVTVTGAEEANTPDGQVALYDGDTQIGAPQDLDTAGAATFTISLAGGTHRVQARYLGSSTHVRSHSSTVNRIVDGPAATTLDVTLDQTTSTYGEPVTASINIESTEAFTADVEVAVDGVPRATVEITAGTTPQTVTLPAAVPGVHVVTAHAAATGAHAAATSNQTVWIVNKATPVVSLQSPLTMHHNDQEFSGEVTRPADGSNPTGHIELRSDDQLVATWTLWPFMMWAAYSEFGFEDFAPLTVGTHQVEIVYSGDARYEPVTWTGTIEIEPGPPPVNITIDQSAVTWGDAITGTVTSADPTVTEIPQGWLTAYTADGTHLGWSDFNLDGTFNLYIDGTVPAGVYDYQIRFNPYDDTRFADTIVDGFTVEITEAETVGYATIYEGTVTPELTVEGYVRINTTGTTPHHVPGEISVYLDDATEPFALIDTTVSSRIEGLPAGDHQLRLVFDGNGFANASDTTIDYLAQVDTETTITTDAEPVSLVSDPLTVTAHVDTPGLDGVTPTGLVQFSFYSPVDPPIGDPVPVNANGVAEFTFHPDQLNPVPDGSAGLIATFIPDSESFAGSSSDWFDHRFLESAITPSVWINTPSDVRRGDDITISAAFDPNWITGEVALHINGTEYPNQLDPTGWPSWTIAGLPIGTYQLEVSHPGSALTNPVTATDSIRVRGNALVTVNAVDPVTYGEPLHISGTVTSADPAVDIQPGGHVSAMPIQPDGTFTGEMLEPTSMTALSLTYSGDEHFFATEPVVTSQVVGVGSQAPVGV